MAKPIINNVFHITDSENRPVPGAHVYTYEEGTTEHKVTYSDEDGTVPHPNPVILDAEGKKMIYGSGRYTVNVLDGLGSQVPGWPKIIEALSGTSSTISTDDQISGIYFLGNTGIDDHGATSGGSYDNKNLKWIIDSLGGEPGTVVIAADSYTFITPIETPENLHIICLNGAKLHVWESMVIGKFSAPMNSEQIFQSGEITPDILFSPAACQKIYASWFGSVMLAIDSSRTSHIPVSVDGIFNVNNGIIMRDGCTIEAEYIGAGTLNGLSHIIEFPSEYEELIRVKKLIINVTDVLNPAAGVIVRPGLFDVSENMINVTMAGQQGIVCDGFTGYEEKCKELLKRNHFSLLEPEIEQLTHIFSASTGGTVFSNNQFESTALNYFQDTAVSEDALYFGAEKRFSALFFNIGTPFAGTGVIMVYEYYNGSAWTVLNTKDGTTKFQSKGEAGISFQPPNDWAVSTVNSVSGRFWVRARIVCKSTITEGGAQTATSVKCQPEPSYAVVTGDGGNTITDISKIDDKIEAGNQILQNIGVAISIFNDCFGFIYDSDLTLTYTIDTDPIVINKSGSFRFLISTVLNLVPNKKETSADPIANAAGTKTVYIKYSKNGGPITTLFSITHLWTVYNMDGSHIKTDKTHVDIDVNSGDSFKFYVSGSSNDFINYYTGSTRYTAVHGSVDIKFAVNQSNEPIIRLAQY